MDRSWYFRFSLIIGVTLLSLYLLYPSYYYYARATPLERDVPEMFCKALPKFFPCKKFNLGLDLQGGVHLVLGVRVDKALEQRTDRLLDSLRDGLTEKKLAFSKLEHPKDTLEIILTLAPGTDSGAVEKYLRKEFSGLQLLRKRNLELVLQLSPEESKYISTSAVEQAIKIIRNRADKLGVTEPTIAQRGADNILIQLPGIKEPEHAIAVIGRTAQLQFVVVDEAATAPLADIPLTALPAGVEKRELTVTDRHNKPLKETYFEFYEADKEALFALLSSKLPPERVLGFGPVTEAGEAREERKVSEEKEREAAPAAGQRRKELYRTYVLYDRPGITGDYLTNAQVQQNPDLPADYFVTMTFDQAGAKIFAKLTEENVRRRMAIVLDGKVNSTPMIQEKIGGGTARITLGGFGDAQSKFQEAKDLALVLKAGALPAPVELREQRQVGKTLGKDSVKRGSMAIGIGALLVIVFMLLYYHESGLFADIALCLNVLLILAILAMFEATLTLPGMAGIVLTIGIAVDANVIILERVREELRLGKTLRAAVSTGYDKAFTAIFDSHVTTLISSVVLMQYGSGPVRGFAITLIIGVAASLFTAVVVTRLIYDLLLAKRLLKSLSL